MAAIRYWMPTRSTLGVDELIKILLMVMDNVGQAIARQLWWAIAHPTSFMMNSRLFTTPSMLDVHFFVHYLKISLVNNIGLKPTHECGLDFIQGS